MKSDKHLNIQQHPNLNTVFSMSADDKKCIHPPEQVFANPDFKFIISVRGLVVDEEHYNSFIQLLKEIGETEFYILEHIGVTKTDRTIPFQTTITLNTTYTSFKHKIHQFEHPLGWYINHFYIFGNNNSWGIYSCECPTIDIIGCKPELLGKFKQVFPAKRAEFLGTKDLLEYEFQSHPDVLKKFKLNYNINEQ